MSRMTSTHGLWTVGVSITLILTSITLASTYVTHVDATEWGLVTILPITFWVGLFLLCLLLCLSMRSKNRMTFIFALTILYLFAIPILIKENQGIFSVSYYPSAEGVLLASEGYLTNGHPAGLMSYHSWPSFLYFVAFITILTDISLPIFVKYFPILTIFLYGILIFSILKIKLNTTQSLLGAIWFLSSFWLNQHYFSPQSMAYIIYLAIFLIIIRMFFGDERLLHNHISMKLLIVILFIGLVFMHGLTPLMAFIGVVAIYIVDKFIFQKNQMLNISTIKKICFYLIVIIVSYNIYIAYAFFEQSLRLQYDVIFGSKEIPIYQEQARISGSIWNLLTYTFDWSIVIINALIAIYAIYLIITSKNVRTRYTVFLSVWLFALGLFSLVARYGPEAPLRAFMFGLIPLSYLSISFLIRKPRILGIIMIILLLLFIPATYGSDTYRVTTTTELKGTGFFVKYFPEDITVLYNGGFYLWYHDPHKKIKILNLGSLPFTSIPNASEIDMIIEKTDYMLYSYLQNNY